MFLRVDPQLLLWFDGWICPDIVDVLNIFPRDECLVAVDQVQTPVSCFLQEGRHALCIAARSCPYPGRLDEECVSVNSVVECREAPSTDVLAAHRKPLSTGGTREPRRVNGDVLRREPSSSQKFIHAVKESGVEPPQCPLEKGVTGSSVKSKSLKKAGIEVALGHEVTVAES